MDWCYVWIIGCIVAAYILRQLVTRNFSLNTYHLALFDEFIGNLVVTVFSLELGILADEYGAVSIVFTASFTSHFYLRYLVFLNGDASETPFYFVDDYFEKRQMHSVISNDDSYIDAIYCYCQWSMVDKNNLDILRRLACTYCAASLSGNYSWDILMALRNSSWSRRCIYRNNSWFCYAIYLQADCACSSNIRLVPDNRSRIRTMDAFSICFSLNLSLQEPPEWHRARNGILAWTVFWVWFSMAISVPGEEIHEVNFDRWERQIISIDSRTAWESYFDV